MLGLGETKPGLSGLVIVKNVGTGRDQSRTLWTGNREQCRVCFKFSKKVIARSAGILTQTSSLSLHLVARRICLLQAVQNYELQVLLLFKKMTTPHF